MLEDMVSGNAREHGAKFNQWFVGDIRQWCEQLGMDFDPNRYHLRSTDAVEIKWGVHPAGEHRPEGWAPPARQICMSLLVRGSFELLFGNPYVSQTWVHRRLENEGDYVLWRENVAHTWIAHEDSIVLTIRWNPHP